MEEGIRNIGKIEEVDIYFDKYMEDNSFLMGRKKSANVKLTDVDFMIGSTKDLEKYKQALKLYKERKQQE